MKKLLLLILTLLPIHTAEAQKYVLVEDGEGKRVVSVMLPEEPIVQEYTPPTVYQQWWAEVMKCSGLYVPPARRKMVRWYRVNATSFFFGSLPPGMLFVGYTDVWSMKITVAWDRTNNEQTVKHEMLHILTWEYGKPFGHGVYFKKCGIPQFAS